MKKASFYRIILIGGTSVNGVFVSAQNLVPNPSFEDTITCPVAHSQMYAVGWSQPTLGTCDYFNSCNNGPVGIPQNLNGWQNARSGTAYAGVFAFVKGNVNAREYIQAKLTDTLVAGLRYHISFYVSLADSNGYACNSFGAYLSATAISNSINAAPLPYIPQVDNAPSNSLTSKIAWVQICDTLIATGNELYITIGNFDDDANSDTIYVTGSSFDKYSYYYVDDVSVYTNDSLNELGVNENDLGNRISLYPNPSNGMVKIQWLNVNKGPSGIEVYNVLGERVHSSQIDSNQSMIDLRNQANGIYFLHIKNDEGISTQKIIIQK